MIRPFLVALVVAVAATACAAPSAEMVTSATSITSPTGDFVGVWPFSTRAQLEAYATSDDQVFRDPVETARQFASRYVGIEDPVVFAFEATGSGEGDVGVGFRFGEFHDRVTDPRPTFIVHLAQLGGRGGSGPWTVVGAESPGMVVDNLRPSDRVSSPLLVTGRLTTYEGNAAVEVREEGMESGQFLGRGRIGAPVSFRSPSTAVGAVVVLDVPSADGAGIMGATVVRVRFAAVGAPGGVGAAAPSTLACNDDREAEGEGFGRLVEVRAGAHQGYDRITFEFDGALPAYEIRPTAAPLHEDPSDLPLVVEGEVFLDVLFRGASAHYEFDASGEQVTVPRIGPSRVTPQLSVLREAAMRGDFEGLLIWTLGTTGFACLRVLRLQDPPRLVIDLGHPA